MTNKANKIIIIKMRSKNYKKYYLEEVKNKYERITKFF